MSVEDPTDAPFGDAPAEQNTAGGSKTSNSSNNADGVRTQGTTSQDDVEPSWKHAGEEAAARGAAEREMLANRMLALFYPIPGMRANRYKPEMTEPDSDGKTYPTEEHIPAFIPTVADMVEHLRGDRGLGAGLLPKSDQEDPFVMLGFADLDDYQGKEIDYIRVFNLIRKLSLPLLVYATKSGGARLVLFAAELVRKSVMISALTGIARRLGLRIVYGGEKGGTEIIVAKNIWLPYRGNECCGFAIYETPGHKRNFRPVSLSQWLDAAEACKVTPGVLATFVELKRSDETELEEDVNVDSNHAAQRLKELCDEIADKVDGRQWAINSTLFQMGAYIKAGLIDEELVWREVLAAAAACNYNRQNKNTVYQGDVQTRRDFGHSLKAGKIKAKIRGSRDNKQVVKTTLIVRSSEVPMHAKNWLWQHHLLIGALELTAGIPGLGKSLIHCHYHACVTNRQHWPDGTNGLDPMNTLMLTAEDSLEDDVVPRLSAANADLTRVYIVKAIKVDGKGRQFLLAEDLELIEEEIKKIGNVGLVTIDPITAYMGGKMDSHKTTEVRSQLGPLKDFAERNNVAVSAVTHPPKNASLKAIDHFIGSQAFIAAARIGHVCIREMDEDGNETGRVLYAHAKHNPTVRQPTFAYRIAPADVGQDPRTGEIISAPRVVWDKDKVDISADAALAAIGKKPDGRKSDTLETAVVMLGEMLQKGPRLQKEIQEQMLRLGVGDKALRNAKAKLLVKAKQKGSRWWWCLPGHEDLELHLVGGGPDKEEV